MPVLRHLVSLLFFVTAVLTVRGEDQIRIGVAEVDITPKHPIRLRGYAGRHKEARAVSLKLWAKALAIRTAPDRAPALLVTFDNCVVPASLVKRLSSRLDQKVKLPRARLTVAATHSHNAPLLAGMSETLYVHPLPREHSARVEAYSEQLLDKLEEVALTALADPTPATLAWGKGVASFAHNRRTRGGPTDHDLPFLLARDGEGKVIAVWTSYACHCTTLTHNQISGDWPGYAMRDLQNAFPGAIALVSAGCGGDQNPDGAPSREIAVQDATAARHGNEIASEIHRFVSREAKSLQKIDGQLNTELKWIDLPLARHPDRAEWERRAATGSKAGTNGYHARVQLKRLDRGEALPASVHYPVQTWTFGDDLAVVFLGGEVVVDYALRLKRELDASRVWINAYTNDVPCYIPSERVLGEGGYEGGDAMIYHDWPAPFAPGLESLIVDEVHRQIPGYRGELNR